MYTGKTIKTHTHINKEHEITKLRKQINNPDSSKNWDHGPGSLVE